MAEGWYHPLLTAACRRSLFLGQRLGNCATARAEPNDINPELPLNYLLQLSGGERYRSRKYLERRLERSAGSVAGAIDNGDRQSRAQSEIHSDGNRPP